MIDEIKGRLVQSHAERVRRIESVGCAPEAVQHGVLQAIHIRRGVRRRG